MRRLNAAGDRFYEPVQILGGPKTRARVQRAEDGDRIGAEFALPKTTLRVGKNSLIHAGLAVRLAGGDIYLVAEHSETAEYRTHHLFPADRRVSWTRMTTKIHPVTQQKTNDVPQDRGMIWVMWERTRREFMDLAIRIAQDSYLVATVADVQLGDFVDNKRVRRVNEALGIKILELQG